MVRSMTGYGRGEKSFGSKTVTVEVRAVNNRYLDTAVKMPRACLFAEEAMKAAVQKAAARGKVDVFVTVNDPSGEGQTVQVNEALASGYFKALQALNSHFCRMGLKDDITVTALARFPEVITVEKAPLDAEEVTAQLVETLGLALKDFNAMREREGGRLAQDILFRAEAVERLVAFVEERSPQTVEEYRAKLGAKMAEVLENRQIDEARLLTEAAIFADKIAVDEETVRLRSHIAQLRELLGKGGAVGRKLDFLIQEFNREANTIGSKCSDLEVTRRVVDMKAEIEKIREQVQNLE